MKPVQLFLLIVALAWVCWLLFDGWRSGQVWARGGSKDRFTRALDMASFAHKADRHEQPVTYWSHMLLYAAFVGLAIYLLASSS